MTGRARIIGTLVLGILVLSGIVWAAQFSLPGGRTSSGKDAARSAPAKVDINTASADDLERLPGITSQLSQRIIVNRPYRKIDDLVRRKVLGRKQLAAIKEQIVVGSNGKPAFGGARR
jgi:competence protein ComEA